MLQTSDNMIQERVVQISQENPVEIIGGTTYLSPIDILFGDISLIVSGRIVHRNYGFVRSFFYRQRDFFYFISIYFLFYRDKKENVDILIHITENTHLNQWLPVYEELKNTKKVAFITSKRKLLQNIKNLVILGKKTFLKKDKLIQELIIEMKRKKDPISGY